MKKMNDYVVEVLYRDANNETQQELLEISSTTPKAAYDCVYKLITQEGGDITYLKVDGYSV